MKKILLVGFGDPAMEDDGLGHAFLNEINRYDIEGVTIDANYKPSLGKAGVIAQHDIVIFADAIKGLPDKKEYVLYPLTPINTIYYGIGKSKLFKEVTEIMDIARKKFNAKTEVYMLDMKAYSWNRGINKLTPQAKEVVKKTVKFILPFLMNEKPF